MVYAWSFSPSFPAVSHRRPRVLLRIPGILRHLPTNSNRCAGLITRLVAEPSQAAHCRGARYPAALFQAERFPEELCLAAHCPEGLFPEARCLEALFREGRCRAEPFPAARSLEGRCKNP